MLFYLYVIFLIIKSATELTKLVLFLLLTLVESIIMLKNLDAQIGKIIPLLAPLSIIAIPSILLIVNLYKRNHKMIETWSISAIPGLLDSFCFLGDKS